VHYLHLSHHRIDTTALDPQETLKQILDLFIPE
jgi:hypothetical protein